MPLVVGNITTVGAFLALVPLKSVALRDLGLFSAALLIGTILFVLLYLPHLCRNHAFPELVEGSEPVEGPEPAAVPEPVEGRSNRATVPAPLERLSNIRIERHRWVVIPALLLTLVFAYYSKDTSFDANMSHINYMTDEQKRDMASLQEMTDPSTSSGTVDGTATSTVYVVSPAQPRLALWDSFVSKYGQRLQQQITDAARHEGFAEGTFDDFFHLLQTLPAPRDSILTVLHVAESQQHHLIDSIESSIPGAYAFDVTSMNSSIATRLSDDFNYIGWACGLIVFFFLWFSLGSIELALLSFLPMAVSWIWILGIMSLLGIQFNVVNVILATFIFGQGDDYTIFMTEGCQYEFAHRRKMLSSYKTSIIISALIMFIGIGSLIFARHPALHALAEVTIVGMFSVVLMAFVFPPLIFRWLVKDKNGWRRRPLTLASLLSRSLSLSKGQSKGTDDNISLVRDIYRYKGVEISSAVNRSLKTVKSPSTKVNGERSMVIENTGWGERSLLLALEHPEVSITAVEPDEERRRVAQYAAEIVAPNLKYVSKDEREN